MTDSLPAHTDRRRAEAFGSAAQEYDRYRKRYPQSLVSGLVTAAGTRALDVGAGTGIASGQLVRAGAEVLAVEPDERMARIARDKGVVVEQTTFEEWQPAGRSFDLVVFAQSFHWVEPRTALKKTAEVLPTGGRLALLSNRIAPISPTQEHIDTAYSGYLETTQRPPIDAVHDEELAAMIEECGFRIERRSVVEQLHYSTPEWLNLLFTYSNVLHLDESAQTVLWNRLEKLIGPDGVEARNDAVALVCTLS